MTVEIMSPKLPVFSRAEQAFRDAENQDEQNLVEQYLSLCSAAEEQCLEYLRTRQPESAALYSRFLAAKTAWNRYTWMQAGHDERIRMMKDLITILQHIDVYQSRRNAKIQQMMRTCQTLIEQLRWIRMSIPFERNDESGIDSEVYP